jgi:TPP-dependent pyruvate/acetoin dehydrogenase alpha subunit
LESLLSEICGRATGTNGGRAGSPYLTAPDHGFLGENSIVGAGAPIAVGVALARQLQGGREITIVSFGDGATSQGALHEALVTASALRVPVVFVCENNGWSEMTPTSFLPGESLALRAESYGLCSATVDGDDPDAVFAGLRRQPTVRAMPARQPSSSARHTV